MVVFDVVWSGREDYDRLRPLSYNSVDVALICYDIMRPESFDNVFVKVLPKHVFSLFPGWGRYQGWCEFTVSYSSSFCKDAVLNLQMTLWGDLSSWIQQADSGTLICFWFPYFDASVVILSLFVTFCGSLVCLCGLCVPLNSSCLSSHRYFCGFMSFYSTFVSYVVLFCLFLVLLILFNALMLLWCHCSVCLCSVCAWLSQRQVNMHLKQTLWPRTCWHLGPLALCLVGPVRLTILTFAI